MTQHEPHARGRLFPLKGAAVFALFGTIWIYASDTVLAALIQDPERLTLMQTYKGWFFILITALLVYSLLHRHRVETDRNIQAMRSHQDRLDLLFQALPIGIGTATERIVRSANQRLCDVSGYPEDELVGSPARVFYSEDAEYDRVGKEIYRNTASSGRALVETRWRGKDGKELDILLGAAVAHPGADPSDIVFAAMDVTGLKEQQALYRQVFESAHDALFLMDGPIFVDCNARALDIYGTRREQIIGSTPVDYSPALQPDGEPSELAAGRRIDAALAGTPQRFDWQHLRGDGTPFEAEICLNRIPLDGKDYLLVLSRDVTESKRVNEALRKSEDSLFSIFRTVPTGIGVISNRILATVNDRFCDIFGYQRDELLGHETRMLYSSEEEYQRCGTEIYAGLEERGVSSVECRMVRRDGREIHVLINSSTLSSKDGGKAVISSLLDITDRNKALEALRDNEEYLASIFRIAPTGIAIVKDRRFMTVNERFADIFGYAPAELIDQDTRKVYLSEQEYVRAGKAYYESIERTGTCAVEVRGVRKDGREIFLLVTAAPLARAGQRGLLTFSVLDISDLKRTERELRAHHETLEEMVRERTLELTASNTELQRLIAESENHSRRAAILNRMGELLQACETEEETYRVACGVCAKLFPDDSGCIGILEEDNWSIRVVGSWGQSNSCTAEFAHNDCWAIRRGKAHTVLDPATDPLCDHVKEPPEWGTICVPMNAQGKVLGITHMRFGAEQGALGPGEREKAVGDKRQLLAGVVERYAPCLVNLRLRETLREQSVRDRLTGLFNRRHMEDALRRELSRAKRRGTPLGLVMIDVDHFKLFNDTYGHETGDAVLRELGGYLLTNVRMEDIVCRFGGEELLLILPESGLEDSLARAEGLRKGIAEDLIVVHEGKRLQVTASLGVAAFPLHGESQDTLLAAADVALYTAKQNGRDQVAGYA